jgi:hypothetical protein
MVDQRRRRILYIHEFPEVLGFEKAKQNCHSYS